MLYEIAHCRHATRGGSFKALVHKVLIGREKKALLWALDPPPPHCDSRGARLERGSAPGITLNSEKDNYSTRQQWGRLLALESQVQVRG